MKVRTFTISKPIQHTLRGEPYFNFRNKVAVLMYCAACGYNQLHHISIRTYPDRPEAIAHEHSSVCEICGRVHLW